MGKESWIQNDVLFDRFRNSAHPPRGFDFDNANAKIALIPPIKMIFSESLKNTAYLKCSMIASWSSFVDFSMMNIIASLMSWAGMYPLPRKSNALNASRARRMKEFDSSRSKVIRWGGGSDNNDVLKCIPLNLLARGNDCRYAMLKGQSMSREGN